MAKRPQMEAHRERMYCDNIGPASAIALNVWILNVLKAFGFVSGRACIFAFPARRHHRESEKTMAVSQLVRYQREWVDALNRGDTSAADQSFANDCVVHITGIADPVKGVSAWKDVVRAFLTAFPDLHFTMEDQLVADDKVAIRWTATGTHRGPLGPLPPTGRTIHIDGVLFDRVLDGKVVERWEQFDQSVMLQQLGVQ